MAHSKWSLCDGDACQVTVRVLAIFGNSAWLFVVVTARLFVRGMGAFFWSPCHNCEVIESPI
jgi:hypothetical protein